MKATPSVLNEVVEKAKTIFKKAPGCDLSDPYNLAELKTYVDRGRRSYDVGISFARWSERMTLNHGNRVIPYLRETWKHVKHGTTPLATDFMESPKQSQMQSSAPGNRSASTIMKNINWRTFTAGASCGLILGFGIFYSLGGPRLGAGASQRFRFEKAGLNGMYMMRLDTRTGKAWKTESQTGSWRGPWNWKEVAEPAK